MAGDICALTKLGTAETGDTVSASDHPLLLSCWDLPEPLLPVAVHAHTRGDEDALIKTLAKLVAADPTLRLERNQETHQTVLWCMGEAHADVVLSRLRAGGAEVDTEPVRVPMRETIAKPARVTGRHVKQSGGHGQYAVCHVEFTPLPRGSGFEFESKVVGGSVPTQFIPSVEKGIRAQLLRGLTTPSTPPSTCGRPWSTARRTASTPPTRPSRPPGRWPTKTGEVFGKTATRHTSAEFVAFLNDIVANQPRGKEIHVILDNLSAHKTKRSMSFSPSIPSPYALHPDLLVLAQPGRVGSLRSSET